MSASAPTYVFPRDYIDNNRINLQHFLFIQVFGYLLHPQIPTDNPNLRVADVGTGTGIWLTELGSKLPSSVQLDALDISFEAVPPKDWLPCNMTLRPFDVKGEVPVELIGVYDIVHIRHFSFILKDDELTHSLENLLKLLKPGGYLQWGEHVIDSFRIHKTHPENKADALTKLRGVTLGQDDRFKPTWISNLPEHFKKAGMENISFEDKVPPPLLMFRMHELSLMINELLLRSTRDEEISRKLEALLPEALEESNKGSCWAFNRCSAVGRKPLAV